MLKKLVSKIIPPNEEDLAKGILDNVDFDSYRVQLSKQKDIILESDGKLMPSQANGVSKTTEAKLRTLIEIIKDDIMQDEEMKNSIKKSDRQNAFIKFEAVLENSFLNLMNKATKEISDFSMKLFNEFSTNKAFKESISQEMFAYIEKALLHISLRN